MEIAFKGVYPWPEIFSVFASKISLWSPVVFQRECLTADKSWVDCSPMLVISEKNVGYNNSLSNG